VQGYKQGPVKRHSCPSHGIALTPDEKELWVADCANSAIHVFDATSMPPKQRITIKARDCVGWVSFSMDGRVAYSSTGRDHRRRDQENRDGAARRRGPRCAEREDARPDDLGQEGASRGESVRRRQKVAVRFLGFLICIAASAADQPFALHSEKTLPPLPQRRVEERRLSFVDREARCAAAGVVPRSSRQAGSEPDDRHA
jgi:hypothetical protein